MIDQSKAHNIIWMGSLFLLGLSLGILASAKIGTGNKNSKDRLIRQNSAEYQFTNPILDCDTGGNLTREPFLAGFSVEAINDLARKIGVAEFSVYFRDLNNGPWLGINEDTNFIPASMFKVPLLISYLKKSELDASILKKKLKITSEDVGTSLTENIVEAGGAQEGKYYSIEELLEKMILQSDNVSANALTRNSSVQDIIETLDKVGAYFEKNGNEVTISVKNYAALYRVLFNSSYLNRTTSESTLKMLSETKFNDGLVSGVGNPKIKIAHKFGERIDGSLVSPVQIHDCGIIYYPENPYLLCVMTRGNDMARQTRFISETSRLVYRAMYKQFPLPINITTP